MTLFSPLKFIGGPGSIGFLIAVCTLAAVVWRLWPERRWLVRPVLALVAVLYLILGLPVVANDIARRLPALSVQNPTIPHLDLLVVFDGDNRVGRVHETMNIWRSASPTQVVVSGAPWLLDELQSEGIPPERISHDAIPSNTLEQVDRVAGMLTANQLRVAVVASRLQMPRIERLMRARGLAVRLCASPVDAEPPTTGWSIFVPSYTALRVSRDALYELAALVYYQQRGWIAFAAVPSLPGASRLHATA